MNFEDFCRQNNIIVQFHSFTTKVRGFCMIEDDYYYIVINSRICSMTQKKVVLHEMLHILNNHLQRDYGDVEECEKEVKMIMEKIGEYYFDYL